MYLCGTKYDLVEENKKARKVESGVVRDYLDGESLNLILYESLIVHCT